MNLAQAQNSTSMFVRDVEPTTALIYVLILITAVTLNAIVLAIIRLQRELQEYMRILYQALATLDMLLGIVWCTWSILWFCINQSLEKCTIAGQVLPFLQRSLILSVMACLCGISFNLYLLITRPLRYHNLVTKPRFFFILVATLIVIVLICVVYLPIPYSLSLDITNVVIQRCLNPEIGIHTNTTSAIDSLLIIVPICLALVFTLVIYGKLLAIVYKKRRIDVNIRLQNRTKAIKVEPRGGLQENGNHSQSRRPRVSVSENIGKMVQEHNAGFYKRFKGIITVLLLYGSFCVVWIPYIIHFSLSKMPSWIEMFIDVISVSNTWTQPMVYLLTNEEARKLCWKFLQRRIQRH